MMPRVTAEKAKPRHVINSTFVKPKVGGHYSKAYFGVKFPKTFDSCVIVNGIFFLFVTIRNTKNYHNELQFDGIVHEPRETGTLVDYGKIEKQKEKMCLFVRYNTASEFEYVGDLDYQIRYDHKRNKLFIK